MNVYEEVIYKTRYAKYLPGEGRREEYEETVDRYWKAIRDKALEHGYLFSKVQEDEIKGAILGREVLPSMRGFMTAGKALDRDEGAIYNCSYVGIDSVFAFQEILFTLMLGTGVGFSVEKQFVSKLPVVATNFRKDENVYTIQDSKEGWADAIGYVVNALYDGVIPSVDYTLIRPKGAKLNTFGGRASGPEPLRSLIEFVAKIMMNAAGRQLRSIEVHDIVCMIASCIVSGGVRRSALISISDLDDIEMRDSKAGEWWKDNMQRALANNSAAYEYKPSRDVFNTEWKALATSGSGERGIFNRHAARKKAEEIGRDLRDGFGTNPCVTGDTWVAVADGRGRVQIKDLAESGEDVDVFTVKDGSLVVRKMLQPRKTGTQVPVYLVKFDDGTFIKVTQNHKFIMKSGEEVQAIDLQPGDSVESMSVYSYSKKQLPKPGMVDYDVSDSAYRMLHFNGKNKSEHRFLYGYWNNEEPIVGVDYHIHHIDYDARNNTQTNLEKMDSKAHMAMHRERMLGANNPVHRIDKAIWAKNLSQSVKGALNGRAYDVSTTEIVGFIADLAAQEDTLANKDFWLVLKSKGYPIVFTGWRRSESGFDSPLDAYRHFLKALNKSLTSRTKTDPESIIDKTCERCGNEFQVQYKRRTICYCSECSDIVRAEKYEQTMNGPERTAIRNTKAQMQLQAYNSLLWALDRHPSKTEWTAVCRQLGIPTRFTETTVYEGFNKVAQASEMYNHKVVSVEEAGFEDVYSGTVEDTHTFFAIGNEKVSRNGKKYMHYVLQAQCGEISLNARQFCNLTSVQIRPNDTVEVLAKKVEIATILGTLQSLFDDYRYIGKEWAKNQEEERLLGVSLSGIVDNALTNAADPGTTERLLKYLRNVALVTNEEWSANLNIRTSAAITCVKPEGTSSQMTGVSSGIHPAFAKYYIRRIRMDDKDPVSRFLIDQGVPYEVDTYNPSAYVFEFPIAASDFALVKDEFDAISQLELYKLYQTYWADHNVSNTVYVRADEWDKVGDWVYENFDLLCGVAFLPASDHTYIQAPYEEITFDKYKKLEAKALKSIDWTVLAMYEQEDTTTGTQALACVSGICDIMDVVKKEEIDRTVI